MRHLITTNLPRNVLMKLYNAAQTERWGAFDLSSTNEGFFNKLAHIDEMYRGKMIFKDVPGPGNENSLVVVLGSATSMNHPYTIDVLQDIHRAADLGNPIVILFDDKTTIQKTLESLRLFAERSDYYTRPAVIERSTLSPHRTSARIAVEAAEALVSGGIENVLLGVMSFPGLRTTSSPAIWPSVFNGLEKIPMKVGAYETVEFSPITDSFNEYNYDALRAVMVTPSAGRFTDWSDVDPTMERRIFIDESIPEFRGAFDMQLFKKFSNQHGHSTTRVWREDFVLRGADNPEWLGYHQIYEMLYGYSERACYENEMTLVDFITQ